MSELNWQSPLTETKPVPALSEDVPPLREAMPLPVTWFQSAEADERTTYKIYDQGDGIYLATRSIKKGQIYHNDVIEQEATSLMAAQAACQTDWDRERKTK